MIYLHTIYTIHNRCKNIFNFNHISEELSESQIIKLRNLYRFYHKQFICYKWKYQKLKKNKFALEMSSIALTVSGAIIGSVTLNPIPLAILSGSGVLIQGYSTNLELKEKQRCVDLLIHLMKKS